jgi:ribosome-associated protein
MHRGLQVAAEDLEFRTLRSRGPGGQNVNKVASAVQLRFDLESSRALTADIKVRLRRLAGHRLTAHGIIVITSDLHRTQAANRREVLERLEALIERARAVPKRRIATAPSAGSRERRLERKRHQQRTKSLRRAPPAED